MLKYYLLAALVFLLFLGLYIQVCVSIPDDAIVYVDTHTNTYYAPPCLSSKDKVNLHEIKISEAHQLGYKPDRDCVNQGGFSLPCRTLLSKILEDIGILEPKEFTWTY